MLSLQLADFGAEVVKVETPGRGDTLRDWREGGVSVHWKVYARNKKSITLDLKSAEAPGDHPGPRRPLRRADRELPLPLSREARGRARPAARAQSAAGRRPRVGLRPDRALPQRPGFGTLVEAMSGFASRNGFEDREPVLPPLAMADMIAGLYGAMATVIAVRDVEVNGGRGQVIDLSLLESIFSILGPEAAIHKLSKQGPQARGQRVGVAPRPATSTPPRTAAGWRSPPRPRP